MGIFGAQHAPSGMSSDRALDVGHGTVLPTGLRLVGRVEAVKRGKIERRASVVIGRFVSR